MDEEDFFDAELAGREDEHGAYIDLCPCCQLMLDDGWCHECRENMDEYQ